jgi:hypothetical protein
MKGFKYVFALLLLVGGSSCKKFLDTQPTDSISPVNYYSTETQLNNALTAVYSRMNPDATYGADIWSYFDIADEMFWSVASSTSTVPSLASYNYTTSDPEILAFWQTLYKGIGDANALLDNINRPAMDEVKRGRIKGQALFLRAYYYFLLVSNFGDVPLILKPVTTPEGNNVARTPIRIVYEQITKDMIEAEGLVAPIKEVESAGRVNKSAVRGILARVYLYMAGYPLNDVSKYEDARTWSKKVIDDAEAGHQLNPSYQDVFIKYASDKYDSKESIWEAEFWGNRQDTYVSSGRLGSRNGIEMRNEATSIGWGYGQLSVLGRQYRRYDAFDDRRDWAIAPFKYNDDGTKTNWTATQLYNRNCGKWRRDYEVVTPKNKNYTPQNFPLLRYSDVLLMFAEADNEVAAIPGTDAINAVNLVRRRGFGKDAHGERIRTISIATAGTGYMAASTVVIISGGGGSGATATATVSSGKITAITITNPGSFYTQNPTVSITGVGAGAAANAVITLGTDANLLADQIDSKDNFREAIQEERARELCFEGLRKMDLIRWGIFVNTLKYVANEVTNEAAASFLYAARAGNNVSDKHLLLPIPTYEMSLNRALIQNPKW